MKDKKIWYAVQESREDDWGRGTYDYSEAVKMLEEQGDGLIAEIDEAHKFCIGEFEYNELFDVVKKEWITSGSYKDFDEKVENYIAFPADTRTFEGICRGYKAATGETECTPEDLEEEYPHYLRIYEDGAVLLFL